ncbi:hypothetical protein [Bradyrhizobium betae]|uniref:Twin-arginine translocation signal domain-containing protein n=1 Tax=Bradyrhizobium betae TaxID=244734 RepID=A0A4Q1VCF1_9BRAD|nr:hypothetical protein [Bradyrhizobium betae]RXT48760.1 hypothetical protein B5V03_12720 [Bradyrhizobium betae]
MANQSRRGFLAYLGIAGASTAAATATAIVTPPNEPQESPGYFKSPAEYLVAMQAIGWQPLAMFHWLPDGGVHRMGVNESPKPGICAVETWRKFHAIQMRAPVQLPTDVHPLKDWWLAVWEHLYDLGHREDVTPAARNRFPDDDEGMPTQMLSALNEKS